MRYCGVCVVGTGPCRCEAGVGGWLVFGVLGVEVFSSHVVLANFDALTVVEPACRFGVGGRLCPRCW